jgi:hypothetical protein
MTESKCEFKIQALREALIKGEQSGIAKYSLKKLKVELGL